MEKEKIKEEAIATEFPFELDAMRSEEMPNNLNLTDAKMYQALSWLYKRYYAKYITREQAKNEKRKLLYQYNEEKKQRKYEFELCCKQQEMFKKCEIAANNYAKQRTLENADELYKVIYNLTVDKNRENK